MRKVKVYRRPQYAQVVKVIKPEPLSAMWLPPGAAVDVQRNLAGYVYEVTKTDCTCDMDGECTLVFSANKQWLINRLEELISELRTALWRLREDKFDDDC